jgi:hypothetical protein
MQVGVLDDQWGDLAEADLKLISEMNKKLLVKVGLEVGVTNGSEVR